MKGVTRAKTVGCHKTFGNITMDGRKKVLGFRLKDA